MAPGDIAAVGEAVELVERRRRRQQPVRIAAVEADEVAAKPLGERTDVRATDARRFERRGRDIGAAGLVPEQPHERRARRPDEERAPAEERPVGERDGAQRAAPDHRRDDRPEPDAAAERMVAGKRERLAGRAGARPGGQPARAHHDVVARLGGDDEPRPALVRGRDRMPHADDVARLG